MKFSHLKSRFIQMTLYYNFNYIIYFLHLGVGWFVFKNPTELLTVKESLSC